MRHELVIGSPDGRSLEAVEGGDPAGTRPQAVQSATGVYYIAVVTALTAEIAVKTRFFPA